MSCSGQRRQTAQIEKQSGQPAAIGLPASIGSSDCVISCAAQARLPPCTGHLALPIAQSCVHSPRRHLQTASSTLRRHKHADRVARPTVDRLGCILRLKANLDLQHLGEPFGRGTSSATQSRQTHAAASHRVKGVPSERDGNATCRQNKQYKMQSIPAPARNDLPQVPANISLATCMLGLALLGRPASSRPRRPRSVKPEETLG